MKSDIALDSKRVFSVERIFDAPRDLVWKMWSEADHLKQWWGPKGWTLPVCEVDFRPGGVWHYCMRSPEGQEGWGKAIYREILAPERLVYTDAFSDAEGNVAEGMPEMEIVVTFTEVDGKTKMNSQTLFASAEDLQAVLNMGMEQGFDETLGRLEDYLAQQKNGGDKWTGN